MMALCIGGVCALGLVGYGFYDFFTDCYKYPTAHVNLLQCALGLLVWLVLAAIVGGVATIVAYVLMLLAREKAGS